MCDTCGCHNHDHLTSIALPVSGICCEACGKNIENTLKEVEGVHHVHVHHNEGTVFVDLEENGDIALVKKALNDLGYKA